MPVWTLHHKESYPQRPYIFFAAFCEQAEVDALDESIPFPIGAEIAAMQASHFRSGSSWDKIQQEQPALASAVEGASLAVTLHGTIVAQDSLDYLKEAIDIMASLVELGAVGVLDVITGTWYDADSWASMVEQGSIFNPFDHVLTEQVSEAEGSVWIKTRGLRKFARPDLSIRGVKADDVAQASKMIDRFINHLTLGGVLEHEREIQMEGWEAKYRPLEVQGGPEDPDFHNTYVEFERL